MSPAGNTMRIGAGTVNRAGLFMALVSQLINENRGDFHLFENHHDSNTTIFD